MKSLKSILVMAGVVAAFGMGITQASAQERQGRGNFDPEQFRERMMERYREQLDVSSDSEWNVIAARIDKVMELRREVGIGGGFGRGGRGGGGGGRRGGDGGEANPDVTALRDALENDAPADDVKAKLAKLRATRKTKEAELEKAQAELQKVLSVKQEAQAYLMGLVR